VISVRLDEIALAAVDLLVNAGLAQSRSEAAAQFIAVGIRSSEELILKAKTLEEHVRRLKNEMLDAVKNKDHAKVQELLAVDEQLKNAKSDTGHTAVLMAAYTRANEIRDLLLQHGPDLDFHEAAAVGHTARMKELLGRNPQLVNTHNPDGYTPLGLAAYFGHEEAAACLLAAGADVNLKSKDGKLDNTALHAAIAGNHIHIVRLLLNAGADIDAQCEGVRRRGFTPLHAAAYFNRLEIAKLLIERGADPRIANGESLTPYEYAARRGHAEIAELIRAAVHEANRE